ncbi:hypothetical protein GCM10017083_34340 [Thalassobaculum fulvum]|uniref:Uncharacterized protein n=1 Tax=Thalassobaculum fulvum TaxID=1633335 RepID=A0A918XU06_9PROT|nr:hypothetical protein [Thalassobaculum fulvum]GHD55429.1 hypothetical protein GCM10017083_34340 [Thalassobaculum fulvum]
MVFSIGPFFFGVVIGFITYRTLRHTKNSGISDLATVIGAVGGGTVLTLFQTGTDRFDSYAIGLAAGFFAYLAIALLLAGRDKTATFLGDDG